MENIVKLYQDLTNKNNVKGLNENEVLCMRDLEDKIRVRLEQIDSIVGRAGVRGLPIPQVLIRQSSYLNETLNSGNLVR